VRRDGPEAYLRVHAVRVFVRDQERSLRFYLDKLGFKLAFDARLESGQRWVAVAPPDGSTVLSLIAPRRRSLDYKLIGRATQVVFVTENVPAKFREWHSRGVRFRHTPRLKRIRYERHAPAGHEDAPLLPSGEQEPIWGGVFTSFEDVDGNSFALVSFDEESRAVEAQTPRRSGEAGIRAARRPRAGDRQTGVDHGAVECARGAGLARPSTPDRDERKCRGTITEAIGKGWPPAKTRLDWPIALVSPTLPTLRGQHATGAYPWLTPAIVCVGKLAAFLVRARPYAARTGL